MAIAVAGPRNLNADKDLSANLTPVPSRSFSIPTTVSFLANFAVKANLNLALIQFLFPLIVDLRTTGSKSLGKAKFPVGQSGQGCFNSEYGNGQVVEVTIEVAKFPAIANVESEAEIIVAAALTVCDNDPNAFEA